jgi:hypothetical protein
MATHYRKDHPRGITAPNPDAEKDIVSHITKHRGMKTPFTSVSEDEQAIRHFSGGDLYTEVLHNRVSKKHESRGLGGMESASRCSESIGDAADFFLGSAAIHLERDPFDKPAENFSGGSGDELS